MYDIAWIHAGRDISAQFKTGFFNDLRRSWVDVAGTYGSRIIYKFQVDVGGNSEGDGSRNRYLRDWYIGITAPGTLRGIRFGVFREPITMSDNTSSLNLTFMERALPLVFAPNHNAGIMFNGETQEEDVTWRFGVFRYIGHGSRERWNLSGRVTAVPWATDEDRKLLHVGASYSHQFRDKFKLRYQRRPETYLGDQFVDTGRFDADGVDLLGVEAAGKYASLAFQSEVVLSRANRSSGSHVLFWGGYAEVSYFLTGEERPYIRSKGVFGRVRLKNRFSWEHRTWGAWQVAMRLSIVDLDDADIRGGTLNNITVGLNWHVSPHANLMQMRFQIDY